MIVGREVRGAHLITAVDHPESFWTEVERKAGRKLSPVARRTITMASDAGPETIMMPKPAFDTAGRLRAEWNLRADGSAYVTRPGGFTRMNLA